MKQVTLPVAEVGLVGLTRAMLAAGFVLLIADKIGSSRRRSLGLPLLAIGALSTGPLFADIFRRMNGRR